MGILTTNDSARAFSSYVAAFGLALLISSIIYLRRLDQWVDDTTCLSDNLINSKITNGFPLCSQLSSWRTAAIVGIIIGVIDTLIVPFICCCLCCTACSCAICVAIGCPEALCTDDSSKKPSNSRTEAEAEAATTIDLDQEYPERSTNKYDIAEKVPSKLHKWLDAFGWIFWVLGPFLATLYITVSLYRTDAIRTNNDSLFNSALAFFIIALFNLMVFFQKFMNSICGYGQERVTKQ